MAAFYERFDQIPIDHAHGMLCNQVALLLLFEAPRSAAFRNKDCCFVSGRSDCQAPVPVFVGDLSHLRREKLLFPRT
jgi:hypothetical protein